MVDVERRRRRWAIGGMCAYVALVGIVLVAPVSYSGIVDAIANWFARSFGWDWFGSGWIEFAANIIMFAPLGFLLTMVWRRHAYGVIAAIGLSVSAELVQALIPSRQPSLRDILANALGAALGAALAWLIVLSRGARTSETTDIAAAAKAPLNESA